MSPAALTQCRVISDGGDERGTKEHRGGGCSPWGESLRSNSSCGVCHAGSVGTDTS